MLAGLSPDYYSRLEQGRQANVSRPGVLDSLARALRLTTSRARHLRQLAAPSRADRGHHDRGPATARTRVCSG